MTIAHNNTIKIYLIIVGIKIKVLDKEKLINFEEKEINKIKESRLFNIIISKLKKHRKYLWKIDFFRIFKRISRNISTNLSLQLSFGFERRDLTALIFGVLSGVLPILEGLFSSSIPTDKFVYTLNPDFSRSYFDVNAVITIKTNIFHMILIIIILVREILLIEKENKKQL
ncbi:MAG: DUF2953 domain-containing protein [Clostridium sp.]